MNQSERNPLTELVADFWPDTDSNHPSPGSDTTTEYIPSDPGNATVAIFLPEENIATMSPGTPGSLFSDLPEDLFEGLPEDLFEGLPEDLFEGLPEDLPEGLNEKLGTNNLFPDDPFEHDLWLDELLKDPF